MSATLAELSQFCGTRLKGDADCIIKSINTLQNAKQGEISFLSNRHYANQLPLTKASAVILCEEDVENCPTNCLISDVPYLAYAKAVSYLYPEDRRTGYVDKSAVIDNNSIVEPSATIAANVVIGKNVNIAAGASIGPGCVIGDNVTIGENTFLYANVTLYKDVVIGCNVILHSGVVIGSDGFGFAPDDGKWFKIPQIGSVEIADDVEVGANTTIDCGAIENTVIEKGVKLDNQVQVGHNVVIGEHSVVAGCTAIAGSTKIGKHCMIGGAVAISGHIEIADDVTITGMSGVANSIKSAGIYSSGIPVTENRIWRRNIIRFKQLDEIIKKIMAKLD